MNEVAKKQQSDFQILVEEFYKANSEAEMLTQDIYNYSRNIKSYEPKNSDDAEPKCETGVIGMLQSELNKLIRNNGFLRQIRDHLAETIGS